MIEAGFDVCIRISPHSDHDKLVYTELAPNSRQLIATPDYLATYGAPEKPADLNKHRLITHTPEAIRIIGISEMAAARKPFMPVAIY